MKKIEKGKDKQANLEDTLEFLSLDDETIESYKGYYEDEEDEDVEYEE